MDIVLFAKVKESSASADLTEMINAKMVIHTHLQSRFQNLCKNLMRKKVSDILKMHHVVCSCSSPEHTIRFSHIPDSMDDGELVWVSIFLNDWRPWWKRAWIAIKYFFGYNSRYGHWDSASISLSEGEKLISFLQDAIKEQNSTNRSN